MQEVSGFVKKGARIQFTQERRHQKMQLYFRLYEQRLMKGLYFHFFLIVRNKIQTKQRYQLRRNLKETKGNNVSFVSENDTTDI